MSKRELGQYFTKGIWASSFVRHQIETNLNNHGVLDPFAGGGDLNIFNTAFKGYDIDPLLGWELNDSIANVPAFEGMIITNPPYLAKNSATRQGFGFPDSEYDDLYKIGLHNCLQASSKVVAIVPESIVVSGEFSNFSFVDILEDNPFEDTEHPVCVIGFGFGIEQVVLKNGTPFVPVWERLSYSGNSIKINEQGAQYTFKMIDGTNPKDRIRLMPLQDRPVKKTDRAYCGIWTEDAVCIDAVNEYIETYRAKTNDLLLKPYKGNNKAGSRRRVLTQNNAKALIHKSN